MVGSVGAVFALPVYFCVRACVVSIIVKHPVLPPCAVDGRSRNPLYYYYFEAGTDCNIRVLHTTLPGFDFIPTFGHPNQRMKLLQLLMVHTQLHSSELLIVGVAL